MMNMSPRSSVDRVRPDLEFQALERLQCGCVALVQQARPWPVAVVSIEAKGPHCILSRHAAGKVMRLGDVWDAVEAGDDDDE
jgi:hypothetical protein